MQQQLQKMLKEMALERAVAAKKVKIIDALLNQLQKMVMSEIKNGYVAIDSATVIEVISAWAKDMGLEVIPSTNNDSTTCRVRFV